MSVTVMAWSCPGSSHSFGRATGPYLPVTGRAIEEVGRGGSQEVHQGMSVEAVVGCNGTEAVQQGALLCGQSKTLGSSLSAACRCWLLQQSLHQLSGWGSCLQARMRALVHVWSNVAVSQAFATWKEAAAVWHEKRLLRERAIRHWANRELRQVS